jgi:hypothetical protein
MAVPDWAKLHPTEIRCTLLSYYAVCTLWAVLYPDTISLNTGLFSIQLVRYQKENKCRFRVRNPIKETQCTGMRIRDTQINADPCGSGSETLKLAFKV